jgi:predicted transcriptional regulator
MGGEAIDPVLAAQAMNLADMGHVEREIAEHTGINQKSLAYIIGKHGKWGELAEQPIFRKLRAEQNQVLETGYRSAAAALLHRAFDESKLEKASTYQLVIASSVALDKARLLAGESTANVEVHTKLEVTGLDNLCSALSQVLLESSTVSPTQTSDSVTVLLP